MNDAAGEPHAEDEMKAQDEPIAASAPVGNVAERIEQWRRRAGRVQAETVSRILEDADSRSVLHNVFQNTGYLADCCLAHPDAVIEALKGEPARVLSEVARDLRALDRASGPVSALSRAIRPCKERGVVAVALAELSGKWPIARVGAALADLGERTLDVALSWLTRMAVRHGDITAGEDAGLGPLPGLFILGGDDLAAGEASYCGPLGIALMYDTEAMERAGVFANPRQIQRLGEMLNEALRSTRESSAIFDLDFDAACAFGDNAAPFALSVEETATLVGEPKSLPLRAWLANARVVAGDRATGNAFLERMGQPFWTTELSSGEIRYAVEQRFEKSGADLLWRLAETCRLALGIRLDEVRQASAHTVFTCAAKLGALDLLTASRLAQNADFLEACRNRMQLITGRGREPQFTGELALARAKLCGYSSVALIDKVVAGCLAEAEQHWLNIVSAPGAEDEDGAAAPNATSIRLEELGFLHGSQVSATVDNWIRGRYGAGDPAQGRRRLSEVAPGLLTDFANTQNPDHAIALFDVMLTHVPAEVDPFAYLMSHTAIQGALVDLLGSAPTFGDALANSPALVEEIFTGHLDIPEHADQWCDHYPAPDPRTGLDEALIRAVGAWTRENRARVVFLMFARQIDSERAGQFTAAIAQEAVRVLYHSLSREAEATSYGRGMSVIALGDFGGRELVPCAPLDVAFVYDPATETGPNELAHAHYNMIATRLAQAITGSGLEGERPEGAFFDIDTRKRPGGSGADIATDINVYLNFYQTASHPDEHVALTRARVICGAGALTERLEMAIAECVTRPRKVERLMIDADKNRARAQRRNRPNSIWDLDRIRGGLGDLCFIAEILQVRFGAEHPYVLSPSTVDGLAALARAGCVDPDTATDLVETYLFFSRVRSILMLTGGREATRERSRQRLQTLIARAAGVASFASVEPLIQGHAERVQAHYKRLILGDESASHIEGIVAA